MIKKNIVVSIFKNILTDKTRGKIEKLILKVALISFFIHLAVIYFLKFGFIDFNFNFTKIFYSQIL